MSLEQGQLLSALQAKKWKTRLCIAIFLNKIAAARRCLLIFSWARLRRAPFTLYLPPLLSLQPSSASRERIKTPLLLESAQT